MKAVIPAAGMGTRFLPFTKNAPKEMLPLVDKPAIQYVVEEAVESGCDDIVIITGRGKQVLEDHFDMHPELEQFLERHDNHTALRSIQEISRLADIHYIRQKEPLGLGHAVYQARKHVGDEPFAVLLGDDIVLSDVPCTKQLAERHRDLGGNIVAVEKIPYDKSPLYGVVDPEPGPGPVRRVRDLVEKPSPAEAPSDLGVLGRYILHPDVFEEIRRTPPGRGGEIQLTDALRRMCHTRGVHAVRFEGKRYDLGNKMDWLRTNIEVALHRKGYREQLMPLIQRLSREPRPQAPSPPSLGKENPRVPVPTPDTPVMPAATATADPVNPSEDRKERPTRLEVTL